MKEERTVEQNQARKAALIKDLSVAGKVISIVTLSCIVYIQILMLYQITRYSKENHKSVTILVDCTTPKGSCYKLSRSQTSGAVGSIVSATAVAAYCAARPENATLQEVKDCISKNLK